MAHNTVNYGRENAIFMILYAPQQGRTDEENEEFFWKLQTEIDNIKTNKKLLYVMANGWPTRPKRPCWNYKKLTGYEQAIIHQGIGGCNAEGKRILDLCMRNNIASMYEEQYCCNEHLLSA